ncbi:SGNH/GDSL hydrolase family protein [Mycolicibacterium sp. S2-37]|uniref:SGNH/GDSL hydrolase family protein n=1 Tax=Mycolicibacterium sp. S2-37 TaxID=2810297 RepID=UPI001F5EA61E|nr:SGNH/GDSL hydrolase family protein [Mycolicibacterium sp. S2-37]
MDDEDTVRVNPLLGASGYRDHWEYTPPGSGTFRLSISVETGSGAIRAYSSRPMIVREASAVRSLRHLTIGDSITRAGGYAEQAVQTLLHGQTVGTRSYTGVSCSEGRGGWTLEKYFTRIGQPSGGDSPFLFPVNVDGAKYLGNTSFWKAVTQGNPDAYDYAGFQILARGWQMTGPYDFDTEGYPSAPSAGDVVVDPSMATGNRWRTYTGYAWEPMNPQPGIEFSFSKYIKKYAAALAGGQPTSISIMLGTVEFLSSLSEESWARYRARLDELIQSIREWNKTVPVILIGAPNGGPPEAWAAKAVTSVEFNRRMLDHTRRLYESYDREEARANEVYVISFLGVVSEENMADYVHPKMPEGHEQMGPWLAGMLEHLRRDGRI